MDFLKELLQIQHEVSLHQVSTILLISDFERHHFIEQFNKHNYCLVKICNCQMRSCDRVRIDKLLSTLESVHNPSSS